MQTTFPRMRHKLGQPRPSNVRLPRSREGEVAQAHLPQGLDSALCVLRPAKADRAPAPASSSPRRQPCVVLNPAIAVGPAGQTHTRPSVCRMSSALPKEEPEKRT